MTVYMALVVTVSGFIASAAGVVHHDYALSFIGPALATIVGYLSAVNATITITTGR